VPLPATPFPGMIVRYSFLWSSEARAGKTEGRKDRPCVVVTAVKRVADGRFRVRVLPITHRQSEAARSVAVPPKVKRYLGLDADASWIVLDEVNEFIWPGVDLRPVSRAKPGVWTFGILPAEMFDEIRTKLRAVLQQRRTVRTD
jgi:PemK-like, MazF-like toxin of type II toxin-antitoxin system